MSNPVTGFNAAQAVFESPLNEGPTAPCPDCDGTGP